MRSLILLLLGAVTAFPGLAGARGIGPGQYSLGAGLEVVCLKDDGTWYGTTFNFGGHWTKNLPSTRVKAELHGGYAIQGHDYQGYGNTAITVKKAGGGQTFIDWFDWFDDLSYQAMIPDAGINLVKSDCDPRFTGENTHAATQ
ncbi:MAG TPA: hypothetical protein VLC74_00745 [Rhizomicrobium sp.]|nr:hypothetical protein [Rhizomicrobium sp.]